jgi:hypothetical protein
MRIRAMAWFLVLLPAVVVVAQQPSATKPAPAASKQAPAKPVAKSSTSDATKIADIRRLLELTGTKDMVNQMKSAMMGQFRQNAPGMPQAMFDEMMAELRAEDLEESMIPVYANHFTGDDIKHLIAFYESPFGKKVMREMPQIITESNEVGVQWGQGVVTRVAGRWRDQGKITQRAYDQLVNAAGPEEEH